VSLMCSVADRSVADDICLQQGYAGHMATDKTWFDLRPQVKRTYAKATWIPLRLSRTIKVGSFGDHDYSSVFEGVHSIAVPIVCRSIGETYSWSDDHEHRPWTDDTKYIPSDTFKGNSEGASATRLVLRQGIPGELIAVWHLHQDLVIGLGLKRDGDVWVRPDERCIDVARLRRNDEGQPEALEMRSEFLRDYLCARGCALRMATYREMDAVLSDLGDIDFPAEGIHEEVEEGQLFKRAWAIDRMGSPFGSKTAVFKVSRTDVDPHDDVPIMAHETDANTESENYSFTRDGEKRWRVMTEFRRDEWLEPASASPRVRWDKVPSSVSFIVDSDGSRMNADGLDDEDIGRWLWFSAGIVPSLLAQPGSRLQWYTRDTGGLSTPSDPSVHFGINESGLVTVYARDVARLPEWERRHWSGFNVTPEGKVSAELLSAQVRAQVAETLAPEQVFAEIRFKANAAFEQKFGVPLFRHHDQIDAIMERIHRFRALDEPGFLSLAKDVARVTADAIDLAKVHSVISPPTAVKLGSLKSVELALAQLCGTVLAHQIMSPNFAAYDLRLADAHLPKSDRLASFAILKIVDADTSMAKGFKLLDQTVLAWFRIHSILIGKFPG
jgi:hypothetical protein